MPKHDKNVSVKVAENGISYEEYKNMVISDWSNHRVNEEAMPDLVKIQSEYDSMSDDELMAKYDKLLHENRNIWEQNVITGENLISPFPKWVLNTGNVNAIEEYRQKNKDKITYQQDYLLRYRIEVAKKASKIQTDAKASFDKDEQYLKPVEVKVTENEDGSKGYELPDVHLTSFQTSGNGCWSCFFQALTTSKGINIPQEEIREGRPNLTKEDAEKLSDEAFNAFNSDQANSAMEMGDNVLRFLPNTMLCEKEIFKYPFNAMAKNITKEQYVKNGLKEIKATITHAIRDEHSPVGMLLDGHYIVITGIDGDKIKFKDSKEKPENIGKPDFTHESTLEKMFGKLLMDDSGANMALQFTYAKEIKLSKDGKTIFGVPSDYVRMFPDGSVSSQPHEIRDGARLRPDRDQEENIDGLQVARYGRVEDTPTEQQMRETFVNGVLFTEKVYIPKQLDAGYLLRDAKKRTLEEENRLRKLDEDNLGNKRPPISKEEVDLEKILLEEKNRDPKIDPKAIFENANSEDAKKREERAKVEIKRKNLEKQTDGVKKAFETLAGGTEYNEIYEMQLITNQDFKIENIDYQEAERCVEIFTKIMGTDLEDKEIGAVHSTYDKFTFKPSPDAEPVNVVEDVRQKLLASGKFGNPVKDGTLYPFVAAQILRLAANRDGILTFTNGEYEASNLHIRPTMELSSEVRLFNLSQPLNDDDRRLAFDIENLNIPRLKDEDFYKTLVGLSPDQLKQYSDVYDKIFRKEDKYRPDEFKINIKLPGGPIREDATFGVINAANKKTTSRDAFNKAVWVEQPKVQGNEDGIGIHPDYNVKCLKASVIMALANGFTVKYGGVRLQDMKFALNNIDKRKDLTDKMTSDKVGFFGSEGAETVPMPYGLNNVRTALNGITADIDGADTKWFRSSGYYKNVKTALKDLNSFVENTLVEKIKGKKTITFDDMDKFFEKSDKLRELMTVYLEHKKRQMRKDANRRNDPSKRNHEQVRIKSMINALQQLDEMTKKVETGALNGMSSGVKAYLTEEYNKAVMKAKEMGLSEKELAESYAVIADRIKQLDDKFYTRNRKFNDRKETLKEARDRIINAVNTTYGPGFTAGLKEISPEVKTAEAAVKSLIGSSPKRLTENELKKTYCDLRDDFGRNYGYENYDKDRIREYNIELLADTETSLYANSIGNATTVPARYAQGVNCIDNMLGISPNMKNAFPTSSEAFTVAEFAKLKNLNTFFSPIGPAPQGSCLSNKDFAAIAFAASMSNMAFNKVSKDDYPCKDPNMAWFKVRRTIPFVFTKAEGVKQNMGKKYADALQQGRVMAADIMKEYKSNDKERLAHLLGRGIKDIYDMFMMDFNALSPGDVEMAARMRNMLKRDPELMAIAMADEYGAKNLDVVSSMQKIMAIRESEHIFAFKLKHGLQTTEEELIEGITDHIFMRVMKEQLVKGRESRHEKNAAYKGEYESNLNSIKEQVKAGCNKDEILSQVKDFQDLLHHKYPVSGPIIDKLNDNGFIEELRSTIKAMVADSTLSRSAQEYSGLSKFVTDCMDYSDLLLNYKKARKTQDGKYDIEKYVEEYKKDPKTKAKRDLRDDLDYADCNKKVYNNIEAMINKVNKVPVAPAIQGPK